MEAAPQPTLETEEALGRLGLVMAQIEDLKEESDRLAGAARLGGATWQQIADAAGIKRQSAHQRWSENGNDKARDRMRRHRERQASSDV